MGEKHIVLLIWSKNPGATEQTGKYNMLMVQKNRSNEGSHSFGEKGSQRGGGGEVVNIFFSFTLLCGQSQKKEVKSKDVKRRCKKRGS